MLPFFKVEAVTGNQRILLWDSHDATSKWLMILDGKRFNFKNTNWRPIQRINDQTYIIPYNDQDFSIEQRLEFSSDFRRGAIIFRFSSNFMHTVQPVLLLDTYLGEDANAPFRVGDSGVILEETEFIEKNIPQKIMSGSYEVPLTLELYSANSVSPARVVLANYVRLNARPYNYTINTGKNFETLYHGNNDSAILLEFFETVVMPGESKDFIISFSFEGVNSESMAALAPAPEYPVDQERVSLLHSYLDAIKAIINNIDTLQAEPPGINETSVSGIESQVLEQERLRTEYENLQ